MLLWKTIDIADQHRALLFRRNRFERVLSPGRHRIEKFSGDIRLETYDIGNPQFESPQAKFLLANYADKLEAHLDFVQLSDHQVGLIYRDNQFVDVLDPGSLYAFWKSAESVRVDVVDIADNFRVEDKLLGLLHHGKRMSLRERFECIQYREVPDEHVGLLTVNSKLDRVLEPGSYGFWKFNRSVFIELLDMRLQATEVNGQEILTKDRVSLRINLSANYRIQDAEMVAMKLKDHMGFIYQELQLRLREAVGTKTLDELLEDKDALNSVIANAARHQFEEYGIVLEGVGVKDIILPGDMKTILNQVVEAQKEAEANVIRRREETQAMRSLHNTAKLMENNPTLLRLKELESLERVTERIDNISVFGGLDGVMHDLVKLSDKSA